VDIVLVNHFVDDTVLDFVFDNLKTFKVLVSFVLMLAVALEKDEDLAVERKSD
jgi:hypothetical protein